MPDRDPSRPEFERAANRAAHEREQLAKTLSEDAQRVLADAKEKSRVEREQKQREQQRRYREDIEKRKALIRDAERMVYRPRWATDRMSEKRIQERAEKEVQANNKAALEAIDKKLEPRGTPENRPMRDTAKPANGIRQDKVVITHGRRRRP